ncbi:PREDICTED: uncharacterized protein C4orf17 homolog [Thamnophis sirtalis]|uniref:Uncharacterized protein C4orf17 homolog n=1 Tax=Thamnophis sirtalis TaxID=35019 RepID=A0A6I9YRY0_9SAUR|nr:PREDICTED: uncharacterized protein C4orf17 homolog [Thamnophis sirtalis]
MPHELLHGEKQSLKMNINFRQQPELQLNYKGTAKQNSNEPLQRGGTYFVCRHSPHPKNVCHIKGLNDAPVCFVRDRGYNEGHFVMPGPAYNQPHRHLGNTADKIFPNNTLPALVTEGVGVTLPHLTKDEGAELKSQGRNTPLLRKKDEPLTKYLEDRPQSRASQDLHLLPLQRTHYKENFKENMNYAPSYLDQEIKILEKLCDILQTDTIGGIQKWLSKASVRDKEFVSNFIRSDMTSRDLLYFKPIVQPESELPNIQALLRGQKGTPNEGSRVRTSSQASLVSRGSRPDTEISHLFAKRGKIDENEEDLPSSSANPSSSTQSAFSAQNNNLLLYHKTRLKKT